MNISGDDWTYLALPVLGDPDPADPEQSLPVVRWRKVRLTGKEVHADQYAIVELHGEDPIRGNKLRWGAANPNDCGTAYFVFKRTKEAAPGDAVVVVHEHSLTVRHYELQMDRRVCLRSVEPACPTWVLSVDAVNVQGVVVDWGIDLHDSGWA